MKAFGVKLIACLAVMFYFRQICVMAEIYEGLRKAGIPERRAWNIACIQTGLPSFFMKQKEKGEE